MHGMLFGGKAYNEKVTNDDSQGGWRSKTWHFLAKIMMRFFNGLFTVFHITFKLPKFMPMGLIIKLLNRHAISRPRENRE